MNRLLRSLLALVARGLRSVAGRMAPTAPVTTGAPPTAAPAARSDQPPGGPPGHWLEMVRSRAPGLHVSLQERGVAGAPRPERTVANLPVPPPSALEPRKAASASVAPRAMPTGSPTKARWIARPVTSPTPGPEEEGAPVDLEPHGWNASATLTDQEEWTRAPTRRSVGQPRRDDTTPSVASPLNPADATALAAWRSLRPSPEQGPAIQLAAAQPNELVARCNGVRAMPMTTPPDTVRHTLATPHFAPSRDEDGAPPPLRQLRRSYPTPVPTPWRVEALQAPPEVDTSSVDGTSRLADARFPTLPDDVPTTPRARHDAISPRTSALVAQVAAPRARHDSSDLAGAWPLLPGTRIPALRTFLPEADRWPALDEEASLDDDLGELASPAGHRERLAREQRGTPWNG